VRTFDAGLQDQLQDGAVLLRVDVAVEEGAEALAPGFSVEDWAGQAEQLGTSFPTALGLTTNFGPGRHDGADGYRTLMYDASCKCVKYTSENKQLP